MNYIIDFDIAALFIYIIVIFFHFNRKNLPLMQNRAYISFLGCAFLATICDVGTTVIRGRGDIIPLWVFWGFHMLGYIASNTLPVIYTVYCISLVNYLDTATKKQKKLMHFLLLVPYATSLLSIVLSPALYKLFNFVWVYYVDGTGLYHRGKFGFIYLYVILIYYVILSSTYVIKYKKHSNTSKIYFVFSYILIMIVSVLVQLVLPQYLVQCFGISLAAVLFSSVVQQPDLYVDRTTNLFNELGFEKMAVRDFYNSTPFLCINIVLDDITFISNAFGVSHMNGFLNKVGAFLQETFPHAYHYYFPQGKFCMVFRNYKPRDVDKIKFDLRARFHENWTYETLELKLYSRFCIIEAPKDVKSPEEILDILELVSEDAHYKQATVYASDIDREYKKRTTYISHLLRKALTEKRFDVYYQPIFSTKEARLIGAEALIRMKDNEGNFVSPEEFIPIAERTGDILRIGQFVFDTVCQTLSTIDVQEYGIRKIDINLSVAQCMQEILADNILTIRTIHNIPASVINLEITETAAAHTPDILLRNMRRLSEEGFELSLDDYGSGYSNMSYLISLPFKMVKIDKNIVWAAFNDAKSNIALASTITMIKRLNMKVLAEGVETEEQANWLNSLGCDYLQGFYYAKGLPKDEYLALMKKDLERYKNEQANQNEYLKELDTMKESESDIEELEDLEELE